MDQPFLGHVHELRRRLMWAVGLMLVVAGLAYTQHHVILGWLEAPLGQPLYYNRVTGAFEFIVQACLLTGLLAAAPIFMYQLIAFVQPAFPRHIEPRVVIGVIGTAVLLIASGVLFGYYISLPAALGFLGSFDAEHLHPLITADSYLGFVMTYLAIFGLVFLLPLALWFVDYVRPLPPLALQRSRKWVIAGAFGVSLLLPIAPDPVSQFLLALPVVFMYEVAVWTIWLRHRLNRRHSKPAASGLINYV